MLKWQSTWQAERLVIAVSRMKRPRLSPIRLPLLVALLSLAVPLCTAAPANAKMSMARSDASGTDMADTGAAPTPLTPPASAAGTMADATVSSPVTGITFEDAPRLLPVDSRFSQAIQTIGFDVGLTCQQIEAYGWKIQPNEQTRVNNIFADVAQELASLGYSVLPQNPGSAAADITVFTASRGSGDAGQTVLFTWSAGKAGLLLLLCEARGDITKQGFGPAPGSVAYNGRAGADGTGADGTTTPAMVGKPADIIGEWPGTYSCLGQGPAGGTLTISRVARDKSGYAVSGIFGFYPISDKNPGMVHGSYRVAGRYDPLTRRALLEPQRWLQRPPGFTYAPLIAEFDIANISNARVSALFQGTTGCTSFEGNLRANSAERAASKAADEPAPAPAAAASTVRKKKAVKKPAAKAHAANAKTTTMTTTNATPASPAAAPAATPAADVPGSTAATSPAVTAAPAVATVTTTSEAPAAPAAADAVTPPSMAAPAPTAAAAPAPAETPVTVPPAPPAAQ